MNADIEDIAASKKEGRRGARRKDDPDLSCRKSNEAKIEWASDSFLLPVSRCTWDPQFDSNIFIMESSLLTMV